MPMRKLSKETKIRMRDALLAPEITPEDMENIRRRLLGLPGRLLSSQIRANISAGMRGRKDSPEVIRKRVATRIGCALNDNQMGTYRLYRKKGYSQAEAAQAARAAA